jgi:hypothetical protein
MSPAAVAVAVAGTGTVSLMILGAAMGIARRYRNRHTPGLPGDGNPLTPAEHERFTWITRGYDTTASEPGRRT